MNESSMSMRRPGEPICAEFVTTGHPDKSCDQMADAILDATMDNDLKARCAAEVTGGHGKVWVTGEITPLNVINYADVMRNAYEAIGHQDRPEFWSHLVGQEPNIAQGVTAATSESGEQGAGDQGIMVGYACKETASFMPLEYETARQLGMRLWKMRLSGNHDWLRPDGKTQVTFIGNKLDWVTIAAHHAKGMTIEEVRDLIFRHVVEHLHPGFSRERCTINGTGMFEVGGLEADAGTTGRKIVVDAYGPRVPVGGGAYSGKDPSKVDRSAAYMCRFVAKNIVANGYADEALVKVGYAIGVPHPTFIVVQTPMGPVSDDQLLEKVLEDFDFRPAAIIERLGLLERKGWRYTDTSAMGHYGHSQFPWEQVVEF